MIVNQKPADLSDCIDELHRIHSRACLLELFLIHNPELVDGESAGEAVRQQAQDVAWQIKALVEKLEAVQ